MTSSKQITGRHVIAILLGFFGAIIVANAIFLTYAIKSFPGESEKKSYLQGLRYNAVLKERAVQAALGWRADIQITQREDDQNSLELLLVDAGGVPLTELHIDGILKRPTHHEEDRDITFIHTSAGRYVMSGSPPTTGVWNLVVRATNTKSNVLDIKKRIVIP